MFSQGERQEDQSGEPLLFSVVGDESTAGTTTTVTGAQIAATMAVRESLLLDTVTPSSRSFTATQGTVSSGTEQVFVNGVLQSLGAANDYTISGNTVTFNFDLALGDTVVISYVKE